MRKAIFLTFFLILTTITVVQAQSEPCPAIVDDTLKLLDEQCNTLDRNSACYGSNMVKSITFANPRPANFFANPGDRSLLTDLREINPQPLDEKTKTFGAAVLNAQANLPNTLPGQGVIFLLMGDARLTNEVAQDSKQSSAFQSFYFLPGLSKSPCYEADPILTIQTPGNITVTISLNGVETEMSPSTLLTITPTVCTIHRGYITQRVGDNTANLLANQTVDIHIEQNGTIVVDNARGISEREYQRGLQIQDALNTLAEVNEWPDQFISEPVAFDTEPNAVATSTAPAGDCTPYTVVEGDTLRKIAQLYNTTIQAIVDANQLADRNLIYVGQQLCIPGAATQP